MFHHLREKKCSIYFLQDTHFEQKNENFIKAEWGYTSVFSSYSSNSRGVAILFNNNFEFKLKRTLKDNSGNFIMAIIDIDQKEYLFVNIYGPNRDDPDFYNNLKKKIENLNIDHIIMAGDFNLVLDPNKDYNNYKHTHNTKSRQVVEKIIDNLNLNDIWREFNPELPRFTWRRCKPFQQARLDFFLISDTIMSLVKDADIEYGYRTDHSEIRLELKLNENKHQKTYWKFNTSLLQDKTYLEEINKEIEEITQEAQFSIPDDSFLDFLLMKIRTKTIAYASKKKKQTNIEEKQLNEEIVNLEKKEKKSKEDAIQINNCKDKLKNIREKRMEGVLLRSRARWIADGEKNTKYFCNLEKRHFISKSLPKLIDKYDKVLTNQEDIVREVKTFYEKLYNSREVENKDLRNIITHVPCLTQDEGKDLEGEITLEEATQALKIMANNKSPGTDGFTVEFFKVFWNRIGTLVVNSLNESFRRGELSNVQKEGIITCIPKGDKPREYIQNWRPISLLNVIYKIGSSCIANRMKRVLPQLIHTDQTGFLKGRYIGENIRWIYDTISYLDQKSLPGVLVNIDFEKAFDSVNWGYMFKVLRIFGFQDNICRWIQTFYKNIKSCVVVNGQVSHWFKIERGCRQGDPLSPYLFILAAEILAIMIRQNKEIKGITINNEEHKISQFADDTEFILEGDRQSFETSFKILDMFSSISGLKINSDKTSIVWLGSMKNSEIRYLNHLKLEWNPKKFKVLGIWFTNDLKNIVNINYTEKIAETNHLFKVWSKRQITPLGRIAILKSLILSKLVYLWLLLPNPPGHIIDNLQREAYKFVWNQKPDKISRKSSHKRVKEGGLGLPKIKYFIQSLKLSWIRKLEKDGQKWKHIFLNDYPEWYKMNYCGPEFSGTFRIYNLFWRDVFDAYKAFFYKCIPNDDVELLSEPVLYNDRIQIGNAYISNRKLADKNVYWIANFYDHEGKPYSFINFKELYDINIDIITYTGIKTSIGKYVKRSGLKIKNNINQNTLKVQKIIHSIHKGSRLYYDILIKDDEIPNSCKKWDLKLSSPHNWKACFHLVHKIQEVKMKWFQLRIIHRCLGTNVILKQMRITTNDKCNFCDQEKDSIEHFIWECVYVKQFWDELNNLINDKCIHAINLKFSGCLVILGNDKAVEIDDVLYFILLFAKQYIYHCKLTNTYPILPVFRAKLKARYRVEEYIARINLEMQKFNLKWICYKNIIDI